jgi:hypothetical protein
MRAQNPLAQLLGDAEGPRVPPSLWEGSPPARHGMASGWGSLAAGDMELDRHRSVI